MSALISGKGNTFDLAVKKQSCSLAGGLSHSLSAVRVLTIFIGDHLCDLSVLF